MRMDEGDLAVLLYRASHAPRRPGVELDVERDEAVEAALRAHGEAEMRRVTRGLAVGMEVPERNADELLRRPGWVFDDLRWELGGPAQALGRAVVRLTLWPETVVPVLREHLVDRTELLVDVETGLLLRLVEVFGGRPVRTLTVRRIGPEEAVPDREGETFSVGDRSMRAPEVGTAARMTVLTLGRMAFDPSMRRLLRGREVPAEPEVPFRRTDPEPLDGPVPSVPEVVRLLALARPSDLAGTLRGEFADGRFAVADGGRFRLDFTRSAGPAAAQAESYDGERHYRLMPDRLVVDPAPPALFSPLGEVRRPRGELRRPIAVLDLVDWEGRRAVRLAVGGDTVVVDAGTGLVLANPYLELHDLGPAPTDPEFYRLRAPEGVPVVETDGGPLGDALLPPPLRAGLEGAARVVGGLAEGVARLLGR
ncbi:hypothetical protein ABH931_003868 [Streptacidiphilus sp. MAP12-33]|uniref:hypothetical protein n=1 Tax=Streptacidiphilus sp. MAP12-33 TaxID=3156266 RepID=UPI003515EFCC